MKASSSNEQPYCPHGCDLRHDYLDHSPDPHVYCSRAVVQAQPNSKGFYRAARRNLWTQVAALCGACAAVATIAIVKQLLPEARRVPVIPVMLYVRTGVLCVDVAAAMGIARCVEVP